MEFPDLGKQCTYDGCSQLDFLPYTCYHCKKIYCQEHFKLDDHLCPSRQDPSLDIRVPTCPICEKPIPGSRNEDPNIRVNRHIQNNCMDEEKPSNVCRLKGCKTKLLVPMNCGACGLGYCVKHRLEQDHQCQGRKHQQQHPSGTRPHQKLSALAAMKRAGGGFKQQSNNNMAASSNGNRRNQDQTGANKQKIQKLQAKAKRMALTEQEQIELATLISLEQDNKDGKNCIII